MKKSLLLRLFLVIVALVGITAGVNAQVTTSSMTGTIKDGKGVLPGASVKATHTPSGSVYTASANNDGRFTIANARVGGPYTVEISFVGYSPEKINDVYLKLGDATVLNIVLNDNSQLLSDVVIKGTASASKSKTGLATAISRKQIEELPAISRSVTDLTRLTPQSSSAGNGFSFAGRNALFNSLTLDGAQLNNVFGLSSLPGGQTGAQPFTLDALDELQINLAPYDVKQSGFTGAGVNAVTKSGTNKYSGSIYTYYKNQNLQGYEVGDTKLTKGPGDAFANKQFGFRLGGPIVKNKLFFFVNGEISRRVAPATTLQVDRGGPKNASTSRVTYADMLTVKDLVQSRFGYDAGEIDGYSNQTEANNITARLDWNINDQHRLTVRYNYLNSFDDKAPSGSGSRNGRGPSTQSMIFSNLRYKQYNNLNSITAELNSRFGNRFANNLQLVYSAFRDYRQQSGGAFPLVDIEDGSGNNYISLGAEPFSGLNRLNQDIYTLNENFNIFAGNHTITLGGTLGYQKFANAFAQFYSGQFRYRSLSDFIAAANGNTSIVPLQYQLTYSADASNPSPYAIFSQMPVAFYAQDEWYVKPNFKLSYGLRLDLPIYTADIPSNPKVTAATFRDGEKLDVGQLPKTQILFSPRFGFNWDVMSDSKLIIRGGSGIFTGASTGVWLTNQAGNTGLMFGSDLLTNPTNRPFNPNPSAYIPSNVNIPSTFAINLTAPNFKLPQVWRSSLAFDYKLPGGILATIEGMYTKSINEIYHRNANLVNPAGNYSGSGDTRPYFPGVTASANASAAPNRVNSFLTNAIVLDNTNQGYAYNVTAQLQKKFGTFADVMVAYTRSDARDITSNPGSQANSAYSGNPIVGDPNVPTLAYSSFVVKNRIIASVNFNFKIIPHSTTSLGFIYEGAPYGDTFGNTRFSYQAGDVNGDGNSNDLMYVPKDINDIQLQAITGSNAESVASQWARLDQYINQDKYLSTIRGQYSERNGAEYPWANRVDVRIMQEIRTLFGKENGNRFQLSMDIINFGNLINKDWGLTKIPNLTTPVVFQGRDAATGRPKYTVNQNLTNSTFRDNTNFASRYQIQIGARYLFN
ncbi:Carboxypeptidase regulatory-like domain-containing protein [Pedobacter rhizosphaerae]|uniref:Carboxypeptidase regulatory-like domain-containing protein n=2 Tax=Pedobacter rhizosphaerae TaxID=390241 RepID=A0A1H9VH44_9SPHI|nr:Carboxypeptidase regulatory-like domain-containing protein [Pedobacter rhizosphaerae]